MVLKNCRSRIRACKPGSNGLRDLESLVADFRKHHRPNSARETRFFRTMPSMGLAIHHVAMAVDGDGRCFDHQFHIVQPARRRAKTVLHQAESKILTCRSFHELHSLFLELLSPIKGLGEMYIYDAALRMGAYVKLSPDFVYLHRGTRWGARALGIDVSRGRPYVEKKELPEALRKLSADNLESFLCIYWNKLAAFA
jgi:hypothetical protein